MTCVQPSTLSEPSCVVPPHLGIAQSAPAPHIASYVPHMANLTRGGLPMTGADVLEIACVGLLAVVVGLLFMLRRSHD
jgi:hypothetical protein